MRQRLNRKQKREGFKRLGSSAERAGWRFNDQLAVGAEVANRIQCLTGTTQQVQEELAAVSRGFEKSHVVKQADVSAYVQSGHLLPPSEEANLRAVLESRKRAAQQTRTKSGVPSTGDTGTKKTTTVPAPLVATGAGERTYIPEPQAVNGGTGRGRVTGLVSEPITGASRDPIRVRPHSSQDRRHRSPERDHHHHRRPRSRSPATRGGSTRNSESDLHRHRPRSPVARGSSSRKEELDPRRRSRSPAQRGGPSHGSDLRALLNNRGHPAAQRPSPRLRLTGRRRRRHPS